MTQSVSEVTLHAKEGKVDLPVPVAEAAAEHGFGAIQGSEGAAGSLYFTFDRGYVRWSNVTSTVSEVKAQ